jgi:hypothetical protein
VSATVWARRLALQPPPPPPPRLPAALAAAALPLGLWNTSKAAGQVALKPSVTLDAYTLGQEVHDSLPPGVKPHISLLAVVRGVVAVDIMNSLPRGDGEWLACGGRGGGWAIGHCLSVSACAAFCTYVLFPIDFKRPIHRQDGAVPLITRALMATHRQWAIERLPSLKVAVDEARYEKDASAPGRVGEGSGGMGRGREMARAELTSWVSCVRAVSHNLGRKNRSEKLNDVSGYFNVSYDGSRKGWVAEFTKDGHTVEAGPYAAAWATALHLEFNLAQLAADHGTWVSHAGARRLTPPPPAPSPHSPVTLQASPATPWCPTCTTSSTTTSSAPTASCCAPS